MYTVKDSIITSQVNNRGVDIDDHITIHVTTLITATIDITTVETTGDIVVTTCGGAFWRGSCCDRIYRQTCAGREGVPFQLWQIISIKDIIAISILHPALGLNLQTVEVELQTIFNLIITIDK